MSIVVDSSVIVAALVSTNHVGAWAERVIEEDSIFAPELLAGAKGPSCQFVTPSEATRVQDRGY